jgi:SAM-dependent methyltransferase
MSLICRLRKFANGVVDNLPRPWQEFYHRHRLAIIAWGRRILVRVVRFSFQGQSLRYFHHGYNETWSNERAIEIPIVKNLVDRYPPREVLEIGNVLSHYFPIQHTVVDRYEECHGVINEDVVDYDPSRTFALIVSISTLEHVGWDEEPREAEKVQRAVQNLLRLLSPDGILLVTLPLGHNPYLDKRLLEGPPLFERQYYCRRTSRHNFWVEATAVEVQDVQYGTPYPFANGVAIGICGPGV